MPHQDLQKQSKEIKRLVYFQPSQHLTAPRQGKMEREKGKQKRGKDKGKGKGEIGKKEKKGKKERKATM